MRNPIAKQIIPRIVLGLSCLALSACVFEAPVFKGGWQKFDANLAGVWTTTSGDEKPENAIVVRDGPDRAIINYPAGEKGWYFGARTVRLRDRLLMQLEILAQPDGKQPGSKAETFTLIWLETQPDGAMQVRALDSSAISKQKLTGQDLRKLLADPDFDWNKVFGSPTVFRKK
ncbi:MAG: hypothetical protein FGM15_10645 [Chthoniobacterales bacterium]|nr:hypothetical protein [Chthoniobacterales bacterium]